MLDNQNSNRAISRLKTESHLGFDDSAVKIVTADDGLDCERLN